MSHRYSTALSHLVLAGTGVYCLVVYGPKNLQFPVASYGLIIANSALGVWRYGNPDYGDHVEKLYRFSNYVQSLFVVPCIAAQVWLQGSINPSDVAYLHAALPLVPLALYLAKKERRELAEIIIALNLASMAVVSFLGKRYYGIAAAVSFAINYFVIKDEGDVIDAIPAQDLFNYGMVFAAYFALKGLRGE